ncbi:hypothetical protein DMY82_00895 [Shigella sonnei]|nr:hypothetical protein [Shigella sonnei]EGE1786824.1 hypothetical protein [Shigella sonnei]
MEYSGGSGLDVLITENKQAVMCHGLFIKLIADIKKPTVKVGFFLGFLVAREYSKHANNLLI